MDDQKPRPTRFCCNVWTLAASYLRKGIGEVVGLVATAFRLR
jgi:hypothetical protein